ncbi:hypothetical protein EXIGLDRAFT_773403 [Exidia glandulosa HHB12029]|uniref:Uncharacterized protein n=1 Tax=Exidia glandulosa HHB12029 TaxID=1314781 RepID=A0A165EU31_EXIGL|nr:hypothetical protein EXIGLDRAFT_773403 [Exidia glandulosa HHB12029]
MTAGEVLDTDACTLFDVFPSLVVLHLSFRGMAPANKFPNTQAPRTLRELTLYDEGDRSNITSLLALWHGHPFRAVNLHSRRGDLVTPALEHLRSISSGPWHIDIGETECVLRTEHDAVYEVNWDGPRKLPDIRRYLGSLCSIAAPAYIFPSRLTQMSNMPSLHSVVLRGFFPASDWELYEGELCVPGLQTLRFEPLREDKEHDQAAELDRCSQYMWELVQRLTLKDGSELPKIPRLVFSEVVRSYVGKEYWAWIYQRASSVYIEDKLLWQEEMDA